MLQERYSGNAKYIRLYLLALKKPELKEECLKQLRQSQLFFAIRDLSKTENQIETEQEQMKHVKNLIQAKKVDIQNARNCQNRQAIKDLNKDLGDLYYQYGDLVEAQNAYFRVHENNVKVQTLDYATDWVNTMIWNQNFTYFKVIHVQIGKDATLEEKKNYQKWILVNSIRNYMKMDFKAFLTDFLRIQIDLLEDVNFITCYHDLGRYFAIACLRIKSPTEIIELMQNTFVSKLLDEDQFVLDILNSYIDSDFAQLIQMVKKLFYDLSDDVHSIPILTQMEERIINYLLKQYIVNYQAISLKTISNLIQVDIVQVINILEQIITIEKIGYLIDPIELTLVQKYTPEQQNVKLISESNRQEIDKYYQLKQMINKLLKYSFSTISYARGILHKQIVKEFKHEVENYQQEELIEQLLQKHEYTCQDLDHTNKVMFTKQFSHNQVMIEFQGTIPQADFKDNQVDSESESDSDNEDNSQRDLMRKKQKEDEGQFQYASLSVDYTVFIQSAKGETIAIECNTKNSITTINFIQPVYDIEEYRKRSKQQKFLTDYTGPEVNKLEEKLKQSLYDYLHSFGINQELNSLIEAYALDKEQRMYMGFLKRMEHFLS